MSDLKLKNFVHKPIKIQALQLKQGADLPDITWSAFKENTAFVTTAFKGQKMGKHNDWVIFQKGEGWIDVIDNKDFKKLYEQAT